ncbi:hypothetical protein GMOD_00001677 [Pyrenophora seminiperda CCB06]|uniref:Uncharacterized protein n=1 Tax=Pyrenophora seminiperda CCB06 TaxID=1302712 RepID=A0A3M7LZW1_9PLEO|nr:hypothetical protein GMOD_00001677 [Pyrenophora seminiperda CCB06]
MGLKVTGDFELPATFVSSPRLDATRTSHRVVVASEGATHVFTVSLVARVDQGKDPRQPIEVLEETIIIENPSRRALQIGQCQCQHRLVCVSNT